MSKSYLNAGVSLDRGYEMVSRIKKHVQKTNNLGSMGNIGGFGGLFDLKKYQIQDPVLVSGTDGVGTKLLIAQMANIHNTIGIDLVAMCVNDIITSLATPLFFLDYIATSKINPEVCEEIIKGITTGCIEAGCALIGGETAEMPGMYQENHYDLAGFSTGVVERSLIPSMDSIQEGDVLIGLPSSGLHSNGFSLVRKILFEDHQFKLDDYIRELGQPLQLALLEPTRIYVKAIEQVKNTINIKGMAHITGGGFYENIPRMIPETKGIHIYQNSFPILPIFTFLQRVGNLEIDEMFHVFNMGIGLVLCVSKQDLNQTQTLLQEAGYPSFEIGVITSKPGLSIR